MAFARDFKGCFEGCSFGGFIGICVGSTGGFSRLAQQEVS